MIPFLPRELKPEITRKFVGVAFHCLIEAEGRYAIKPRKVSIEDYSLTPQSQNLIGYPRFHPHSRWTLTVQVRPSGFGVTTMITAPSLRHCWMNAPVSCRGTLSWVSIRIMFGWGRTAKIAQPSGPG